MPSAPNPIQTALLILTPIRSNRCAQLLRRHSPQGGTPTLRHGASTIYTSRAPAPDSPTPPCISHAAHRRNRHTQPARLHPPQTDTPRSGTAHASARTSTHQLTPAPPPASSPQHVPHAQCCPKSRLSERVTNSATAAEIPCNPYDPGALLPEHIANSGFDWAPHDAQLSRSAPSPPPRLPRPSHTDTKKGQTFRSDLEEAATYSPTGKPQYHRRE